MGYKKEIAKIVASNLDITVSEERIISLLEVPKHKLHGDIAFPCFELAKVYRRSPTKIAAELAHKVKGDLLTHTEAVGPYVNFFLNRQAVSKTVLNEVVKQGYGYGQGSFGTNKTVLIDFSSPNIAKPFSMGHLRSTVIGNSLAQISEKCGYMCQKINHLGDWGTQFGKLMVAYKLWGNEENVAKNPIKELFLLYTKFHEQAEVDPSLTDEARKWFKKLEDGDKEAHELWKWFREESLKEFNKLYTLLGVSFDSYLGEAFYNDKMGAVVAILEENGLLTESNGADVVELAEKNIPPCLIRKSDGATLYATRDLAAALYRKSEYHFDQALYVVGNEQSLHFTQVFAVLERLGFEWSKNMSHIPFGMMLKGGKKMSTRKGKVVLLEEVIEEAISQAYQNIEEKNPDLQNKVEVAKHVGVGAVIFHDLKNYRMNDVEFSLQEMLKFEGETGPYVQYTYARACSILRKANHSKLESYVGLEDEYSWEVVKDLLSFPDIINDAFVTRDPSKVAKYIIGLSQAFNKFYANIRILDDLQMIEERLTLVRSVCIVLKEGLRLLGMKAPEEM